MENRYCASRIKRQLIVVFLLIFYVAGSSGQAHGETKAVNEWAGDTLSHTLKCQRRDDLKISSLPGFLQVLISAKPIRQVRHLPVSDIKVINYFDYGVYITWQAERMKNGKGYMTTTVYVPREVQPPGEIMSIIKDAIKSIPSGG